jgi:threonine aldolase
LSSVPDVKIVYPVEANGVFARIPSRAIPKLLKRYFFYPWDIEQSVVRWMCSWDTTEDDVKKFVVFIQQTLGSKKRSGP